MSLNERWAFYHLLGDAGGSVAVIVSTLAVAVFNLPVADPIAAVLIGILVLVSAGNVLWESTSILLERSPVSAATLQRDLADIDGVERIDDLHVWQVCSQLTVATIRVRDTAATLEEQRAIRTRVREYLTTHGIDHATIELVGPVDSDEEGVQITSHTH